LSTFVFDNFCNQSAEASFFSMASGSSLLHFFWLAFFLAAALQVLLGLAFFLAAALLLGLAFFLAAARVWSFGFVFGHASGIFGAGLRARVLAGVMRTNCHGPFNWVGHSWVQRQGAITYVAELPLPSVQEGFDTWASCGYRLFSKMKGKENQTEYGIIEISSHQDTCHPQEVTC
jgi:hypothetical protein